MAYAVSKVINQPEYLSGVRKLRTILSDNTLSAQQRKIFKGTQLEYRYTQNQKPAKIELWAEKKPQNI